MFALTVLSLLGSQVCIAEQRDDLQSLLSTRTQGRRSMATKCWAVYGSTLDGWTRTVTKNWCQENCFGSAGLHVACSNGTADAHRHCAETPCASEVCPSVEKSWKAYGGKIPEPAPTLVIKEYEVTTELPFFVREIIPSFVPGTQPDTDLAQLVENDGDCWMVFRGSDNDLDYFNIFQPALGNVFTEKWGISGLHKGVVDELSPLVEQMDFAEIRRNCPGKFTVTGHSLGGALAQMFAVLLTRSDDPLNAGITLDSLYTFGSFGVTNTNVGNEQSDDGCFRGAQFFSALPSVQSAGKYAIDIVEIPQLGADFFEPIRSDKILVFADGSQVPFPCGQPLTDGVSIYDDIGPAKANLLHKVTGYRSNLGCGK